jgi:hypothetical protein
VRQGCGGMGGAGGRVGRCRRRRRWCWQRPGVFLLRPAGSSHPPLLPQAVGILTHSARCPVPSQLPGGVGGVPGG